MYVDSGHLSEARRKEDTKCKKTTSSCICLYLPSSLLSRYPASSFLHFTKPSSISMDKSYDESDSNRDYPSPVCVFGFVANRG